MNDNRQQLLAHWTNEVIRSLMPQIRESAALKLVSGDASFRRYFRARAGDRSFIAVDAPPENEDSQTFVRICDIFREAGVMAPKVFSADYTQGFMLLDDFGDELFLNRLLLAQQQNRLDEVEELYRSAISALLDLQTNVDKERLDPYDRKELHREMALFEEWFCVAFLELELSDQDRQLLENTFTFLSDAALSQPQVAVHRDYHSRNLMILNSSDFAGVIGPGIIDFQDAVRGAYTYDLVSLLRDAYIRWDRQLVEKWALSYLELAVSGGIVDDISPEKFLRDFDLMGLQRNLKVMGIFARLGIRDNKLAYLADIPLVIQYFLEVSQRQPEMRDFVGWLKQTMLPAAKTKLDLDF